MEGAHPKTDIVVPVVRVIVVAVRDTRVVFIVVPRAAAHSLWLLPRFTALLAEYPDFVSATPPAACQFQPDRAKHVHIV